MVARAKLIDRRCRALDIRLLSLAHQAFAPPALAWMAIGTLGPKRSAASDGR
jgi:hypothetical protein